MFSIREDCEVKITNYMDKPMFDNSRPCFLVLDDYLTSGQIIFFDRNRLLPGESALAVISFISPEVYPNSLWIGREISVQVASKIIGIAKVVDVYNEILKSDGPRQNLKYLED